MGTGFDMSETVRGYLRFIDGGRGRSRYRRLPHRIEEPRVALQYLSAFTLSPTNLTGLQEPDRRRKHFYGRIRKESFAF